MAKQNVTVDLNEIEFHSFSKGWSADLDNHVEPSESYSDAWNGRLYSENGTLAFVSINGSKFVYNNDLVVKYNGHYAFQDELIVFAKGTFPVVEIETEPKTITEVTVKSFSLTTNTNLITGVDFASNFQENSVVVQVPVTPLDEDDFTQNLTVIENINTIDVTYGGLFKTLSYMPEAPIVCPLNTSKPINNEIYNDAIFSFKYNEDGTLEGTRIYVGNLNIPMDAIITTEGVEENSFYKRVYFSDYYNPTRVVNIKDQKLAKRNPFEFDIKTKGMLLNPRIKSIENNGQLKAMTVFYVMKLITENGQVSDFSALSKGVKIGKASGELFSGGEVSEITNKSVKIECYIPDYKNFKEVQLVAIEFEANNVPTSIRLVGTKTVNAIVGFEHFGSEAEYAKNITLADLFKNSISWRYNSDFTTKNNKLLVSGLRNDPLFLNSKNMALDFSLCSFNAEGETHSSLLNPDPLKYNLINANQKESFLYVQRKLYRKIEVFGNYKMQLYNNLTSDFYEFTQNNIVYDYVDYTSIIADFLLSIQSDNSFASKFPNLRIKKSGEKILFEPINESIKTDFYNYNLVFSTPQVIMILDNDTEKKTIPWPSNNFQKENSLVYGGVSNGWFNGNGVRVTMHSESDAVLTKNTDWMNGNSIPLKIKEPTLKKGVMKGEIYRIGIQWYKNGNRLFTTILGDLKIPDIGQRVRELDIDGKVLISNENYSNWKVEGNEMYANRIVLQFDVRLNCALSNEIDSYQIVYVERDENNRTILAQGISAPLERLSDFTGGGDDAMDLKETMVKKWMLPSNGGPVYDEAGLKAYDANPDIDDNNTRVITNRKSFYFDSPDLVYSKISANYIDSCVLEYIETLATDHDRHNIMGPYNKETASPTGSECYYANGNRNSEGPVPFGSPKFSQKIPSSLLSGGEKIRPFWVNTSVFATKVKGRVFAPFQNEISPEYQFKIDKSQTALPGEILSGYKMNDKFDFANHAFTLASPGWFYQAQARSNGADKYSLFRVNNIAGGRETVFIKTKENYFSNTNIGQTPYIINSRVNFGTEDNEQNSSLKGHDAYIVSNLKRNNADSVYGGRSEFAYSSNEYIPLSDVFPVINNIIASQVFYVEGDTYSSLYLRNKTSYKNTTEPIEIGFHWSRKSSDGNRKYQYNKYNAWCYAVVLESTVEPRLNNSEEFYQFSKAIDFNYEETYNAAYLQENDLKKSVPIPYNFKDDPILNNIIAASKVKLSGDYIDAWTEFLTNEFYELDKNMGSAFNILKHKDAVYVIQENQTSEILIDERNFITPDEGGAAIQIGQGSGNSISGHTILSKYGTSFRRAVIESDFGFMFFDEKRTEIIKNIEPLLLKNNLAFTVEEIFKDNKVVAVEGYYDDEFKETNIRFRTANDFNFVISYNELLKTFNGKIDYDNDLYFVFQKKVIAPYHNSKKLGELNHGHELLFFNVKKNLKLKVVSAPNPTDTKINKGIAAYININYPILKTTFITSLGHFREILGTHHWYKIREGIHTLPAKNATDYSDIRGEWCSIEIEVESKQNKRIRIFSLLNYFRKSYK